MSTPRTILLVEDNPQDEMLILRSLRKANMANRIDVARDAQRALDYLFCQGKFAIRNRVSTLLGAHPYILYLGSKGDGPLVPFLCLTGPLTERIFPSDWAAKSMAIPKFFAVFTFASHSLTCHANFTSVRGPICSTC